MAGSVGSSSFTLAYVPGVTPGKWVRTWNERVPSVPLHLVATPAAAAASAMLLLMVTTTLVPIVIGAVAAALLPRRRSVSA